MFRRLLVGGGVSLLLSMGGMAGGVLANLFLSRNLGASAFGTYSIALATAMITAIVCAGGLEASVVRLAPERFASGHGLRALSRYVLQVQGALHVAAAVFLILAYVTASRLFGLTQPWDVLSIVAIAFASARLTAQGMVFRAGGHFVLAQLYQHPIRSFLLLALVVAAGYVLGPLDPSQALAVTAVSVVAVWVASSCHAHAIIGRSDGGEPAELDRRRVLTFGAAAVVAGALQQAGTHAPVFLLGTLTSHEQAGYFAVISRLTTLITVVTAGLATFVCPAIVIAWRDQDWSGLLSLVRASAWLSLGSASIGALALILAGDWVLIIFGPEFRAAYPGLVVLSVCVALSMATGVAASLLAMTDNEREVPIGVAVGLAVQLPLAFWLIPRLGLVGAAAAAGLGLVSCNAYWAWQVRRKLGIDCTVAAIRHDLSATKGSHRTGFGAAPLKDENPTYIEAEVRRIGGSE